MWHLFDKLVCPAVLDRRRTWDAKDFRVLLQGKVLPVNKEPEQFWPASTNGLFARRQARYNAVRRENPAHAPIHGQGFR